MVLLSGTASAQDVAVGRRWPNATLLPSGEVVICGGNGAGGMRLTSCERFSPAAHAFATAPPMSERRGSASSGLLPDGTWVLVGGGSAVTAEALGPQASAFRTLAGSYTPRYDMPAVVLGDGRLLAVGLAPVTLPPASLVIDAAATTVSAGPQPLFSWTTSAASRLLDGRVLVSGGSDQNDLPQTSCQLFSLDAGWSTARAMGEARAHHTQTVLNDGRVLVAGGAGADGGSLGSAELYDPVTDTWTLAGPLQLSRVGHHANLLPDGRVFLTGGIHDPGPIHLAATEVFDPTTGNFLLGPVLSRPRTSGVTVMLPTSELMFLAGVNDAGFVTTTERYHFTQPSHDAGAPMPHPRADHIAQLLPDGRLLVVGGNAAGVNFKDALFYDAERFQWSDAGFDSVGRHFPSINLLLSGEALVCGGQDVGPLASCSLYSPATGTFRATGSLNTARFRFATVLLADGRVLAVGGNTAAGDTAEVERFDPQTGLWTPVAPLPTVQSGLTARLLNDGTVLVASQLNYRYLPQTDQWLPLPNAVPARSSHAAVVLADGRHLMIGGGPSGSVGAWMPDSGTWVALAPVPVGLHDHEATLLDDGRVLVSGGQDSSAVQQSGVFFYDPESNAWTTLFPMGAARDEEISAWLPTGDLLLIGGNDAITEHASTELVFEGRSSGRAWAPRLDPAPATWPGGAIRLTGARLTGLSQGSGGLYHSVSNDVPGLTLRRADGDNVFTARLDRWAPDALEVTVPANLPLGWYWARVSVNGVPSRAVSLLVGAAPGTACTTGDPCASQRCVGGVCDALIPAADGGIADAGQSDGGSNDAGSDDAGPADAGDGGGPGADVDGPTPRAFRTGCGCGSADLTAGGVLGLLLAALARRRRAQS